MSLYYRTPQILIKTVAATNTPERISATRLPVSQCIVIGNKAAQEANTTDSFIGPVAGDGNQPIPLGSGGQYSLVGVDLFEWYLDVATAGDGVVVVYW